MKFLLTKGLKAVLPQSSADSIFRLGVKLAPAEFRRYAFENAFAPEMRFALQKLASRGFVPETIADVGSYHGDWSRMVKSIWPEAKLEMIEAMRIYQRIREFLQCDVGFGSDDFDQKLDVWSQLAVPARRSTLWLGHYVALRSMRRCKTHCRSGTDTKHTTCCSARMARQNISTNPFPKIQRIRSAHDPPPKR